MSERGVSEASSQNPKELILLQFPLELRERAARPSTPTSEKLTTPPPSKKKRRKPNRWGRRFRNVCILLVLFMLGASVWGLEQEYRSQLHQGDLLHRFTTRLTAVKKSIASSQSRAIYVSLPRYLKHLDKSLTSLRQSKRLHCQKNPQQPPTFLWKWPRKKKDWHQAWMTYRRWLWPQFQPAFLQARTTLFSTQKPPSPQQRKHLCQSTVPRLLQQLRAHLYKSSSHLLQEARRHLRFYGWCQMYWSRYQTDPKHRRWLTILRQRSCRRSCHRKQSPLCRSCLDRWRVSLQLRQSRFSEYHKVVRLERQRRCLYWGRRKKKPAHQGEFHLGEYFWRVRRVLTYTRWLQHHQLCDKPCQKLQKEWGFTLHITASDPNTEVYVRLWPEQHKAPTSWLRQIPKKSLGSANGEPLLIPALRTDILGTATPKKYWMLLLFLDARTRRKAYLPLAPEAGGSLKQELKMRAMEIYNDGRQPVRFPTFSRDEHWFAFATFQQYPWQQAPTFHDPHCWATTPYTYRQTGVWRSAISVYPLNEKGQPSTQGKHLLTEATLHQIEFDPKSESPQLLISSEKPPRPFARSPKSPFFAHSSPPAQHSTAMTGEQASLWSMKLDLVGSVFFGSPRAITQSIPHTIDLPFHTAQIPYSVLRLRCPLPSALSLLQRGSLRPTSISLPQGHQLLHATSSTTQVTLLLQNPKNNYPSLATYPRPLLQQRPAVPEPLLSMFRQVRLSQGVTLLAGGLYQEPLVAQTKQETYTLQKGRASVRYLDPIIHRKSRRVFVIEQWSIPGSKQRSPKAIFLISVPLPKKLTL